MDENVSGAFDEQEYFETGGDKMENDKKEDLKVVSKAGLEILRMPFLEHQIKKLPKPTKAQTEEVKADYTKGIRCAICGGWHHPNVVHFDYVGHAALTDRLLDADPFWNWEPLAVDANGLPLRDAGGGLWIKLTVCGVTRLGYGDAEGKTGGNAIKEIIGDGLRNSAMRFGAALECWHKGDLHIDEPDVIEKKIVKSDLPSCPDENFSVLCADRINDETGVIEKMGIKSLIQSSERTASDVLGKLQTRFTLTAEQIATVKSWEAK